MNSFIPIFILALTGADLCYAKPHSNIDWDILIFTQSWPISVCASWEEKGGARKHNTCDLPNSSQWTIHGIWPTKLGTKGPNFCTTNKPFNKQDIYGLIPQLEQRWTPVEVHLDEESMWKHEWEKHGSCALSIPQLATEFKYFSQGLSWNQKYEMGKVLHEAGINPGKSYAPKMIIEAVEKVLGKKPNIACYEDKKRGVSLLQEVRICFDKDFKLVDCDSAHSYMSGCSESQVDYPKSLEPLKPAHHKSHKKFRG